MDEPKNSMFGEVWASENPFTVARMFLERPSPLAIMLLSRRSSLAGTLLARRSTPCPTSCPVGGRRCCIAQAAEPDKRPWWLGCRGAPSKVMT